MKKDKQRLSDPASRERRCGEAQTAFHNQPSRFARVAAFCFACRNQSIPKRLEVL